MAVKVDRNLLENFQQSMNFVETNKDYVWKMVCWIDSKAMFGDVNVHQSSVLPQAEAYLHRFGPGLILYWFGHAPIEMLQSKHGEDILVTNSLPEIFLTPTGGFAGDGKLLE